MRSGVSHLGMGRMPLSGHRSRAGQLAFGGISRTGQSPDGLKELRRLTLEQQIVRECLDRRDCTRILRERRTDDRAGRQTLLSNEVAWLGQDQVGLEVLSPERRGIEIRKGDSRFGVSDTSQMPRHSIPCLVMTAAKILHLGPAN